MVTGACRGKHGDPRGGYAQTGRSQLRRERLVEGRVYGHPAKLAPIWNHSKNSWTRMVFAVARVHLLTDDLLFGSRLEADLRARGHAVSLGLGVEPGAELIVADLTVDAPGRIDALYGSSAPVLAFYSHVEVDVRELAQGAGFAMVVPRSRIAREAPELVERLLATAR